MLLIYLHQILKKTAAFSLKMRMLKSLAFIPASQILTCYDELKLNTDDHCKKISDWFKKNYIRRK